MKKKNIVGHMMLPKESAGNALKRWQILPRLLCLLLAVLIWLLVVNVEGLKAEAAEPSGTVESAVTEEA